MSPAQGTEDSTRTLLRLSRGGGRVARGIQEGGLGMVGALTCLCRHDEDAHTLRQFADIGNLPHCDECCPVVTRRLGYHDDCFDCAGFMRALRLEREMRHRDDS